MLNLHDARVLLRVAIDMNRRILKVIAIALPFAAAAGASVVVSALHGIPPTVALSNWWGGGGFWPKVT